MTNIPKNIPTGYKSSPLGIIPEDWEVKRLGECTNLLTNGFVGVATPHYTEDSDGITYIQGFNVTEGGFNLTGVKKVTKSFHKKNSKSSLREGDLLTIQTGDIGLTTIVTKELEGSNCHALIISRFKEMIMPQFMLYYYNSTIGRNRFRIIETGTTMKHINTGDLVKFSIPVPPLSEQQRIVSVLSLWDTAIDKQTALIEKLTLRKRGLMQQLLTGKKRLKGFEGDSFKMMSFDKIANTVNVKAFQVSKSDYQEKGKTPIVDQGQMFIAAYSDSEKIFKDVPFILFGDHTRIIKWIDFPCVIGADGVQAIKSKVEMDIKYLYYLLSNTELPNLGYSRHMSILKEKVFYVSTNHDEQKAIAECLSRVDVEIEIQKRKLSILQEQKRGLMQVLLTGKRRVK